MTLRGECAIESACDSFHVIVMPVTQIGIVVEIAVFNLLEDSPFFANVAELLWEAPIVFVIL